MEWKDVAGKVVGAAPLLGTLLGGPMGTAIGGVVALIGSALGLAPNQVTPETVNQVIGTDPNALIKLKEMELNHKLELEKLVLEHERLGIEEKRMELADAASARQREMEITKATGKRDINMYILAWIVVGGFFLLVGILMRATLPEANIGPINQLFGAMSTGFGMVLSYFFGSSMGSARKSEIMELQQKRNGGTK